MKNALLLLTIILTGSMASLAQDRYFTRDGHVDFYSSTPVEDIEANNEKMSAVIDFDNGAFEFAVLIKSFEFEKALMEEHFNENYMESNDFPKATFVGKIDDFESMRDSGFPPGVQLIANGKMTIHGVTQDVALPGTISKKDDGYHIQSTFMVKPADYDIEIPNTVRDNIAKEIKVNVSADLKPLKR